MKKLKRLLDSGDDTAILTYIKGDFRQKIDEYLAINDRLSELKKRYCELAAESEEREVRLNNLVAKMNQSLESMQITTEATQ